VDFSATFVNCCEEICVKIAAANTSLKPLYSYDVVTHFLAAVPVFALKSVAFLCDLFTIYVTSKS